MQLSFPFSWLYSKRSAFHSDRLGRIDSLRNFPHDKIAHHPYQEVNPCLNLFWLPSPGLMPIRDPRGQSHQFHCGGYHCRYHRLMGHQVLMVSGSDSHGTPTTLRGDAEKTTPWQFTSSNHETFLDLFQKMASPTTFSPAPTLKIHTTVSQAMFKALLKNGLLYTE